MYRQIHTHLCIRHGVQTSDCVWENARSVFFFQIPQVRALARILSIN